MKTSHAILLVIAVIFIGFILWAGNKSPASIATATPQAATSTESTTQTTKPLAVTNNTVKTMTATITTNQGVITLELYPNDAPNTVANFKKLADSGFYNDTRFHRVIKDFMIQGGDPLSKDVTNQAMWGTGGPGYKFNDEINSASDLYKTGYQRGVLAMANSGPNTNGSQFFIMHKDYPLPPLYTIFGRVTSGLDVVDKIATTPTSPSDRPIADMIIEKIEVK